MKRTVRQRSIAIAAALFALGSQACMSPGGKTLEEKRSTGDQIREQIVQEFYERRPDLKSELESAPGYIAGTIVSIHPGLFSAASGYGVIFNRAAQQSTYYRQGRFALGPGLAIKRARLLVIVHDPEVLTRLRKTKWMSGAEAESSFKFGDFGGSATVGTVLTENAKLYIWTAAGFALEIGVGIARFSAIEELNEPPPIRGAGMDPEAVQEVQAPAPPAP